MVSPAPSGPTESWLALVASWGSLGAVASPAPSGPTESRLAPVASLGSLGAMAPTVGSPAPSGPTESRLALVASLGSLGAVTAVGLVAAGGYYLKTTACKKGEYNVRDAEGSSEATCLHRHRHPDVFGIQLTQP
ncbi:PREDICTED: intercellular adhesion molecule 5-like [Calidris pugnax]|uniref:intercellular adhesion molecule 5-like n=1 Tax=Calidris pugnax TaxID=198806 RepID=UPI00071C85B5|nr:PREDICTED: intercellular adhesion molecule 5-like [Calidris pugnax]